MLTKPSLMSTWTSFSVRPGSSADTTMLPSRYATSIGGTHAVLRAASEGRRAVCETARVISLCSLRSKVNGSSSEKKPKGSNTSEETDGRTLRRDKLVGEFFCCSPEVDCEVSGCVVFCADIEPPPRNEFGLLRKTLITICCSNAAEMAGPLGACRTLGQSAMRLTGLACGAESHQPLRT